MKLADYRNKRDPARTNEPLGRDPVPSAGPTTKGAFVVHLHDATRRHYDLRLEVGGVLKSFAVPKGPSLDPDEKRFAVHTEDHPVEYLYFEAVIPDGNYGAGPMILWDTGTVEYLEPAEQGLEEGKLDFVLTGHKLGGRFALVRLKGTGKDWLLFKKKDTFANSARDVVVELPRSVLSGLTVEELSDRARLAGVLEEHAAALGAPIRRIEARKVCPMLCSPSTEATVPHGDDWIYELKLDGVRIIAGKDGDDVSLTYRSARDTTASYPEVVRALRALGPERLVLDGEIVAFDEKGHPNFQRLGQRIHLVRPKDVEQAMRDVPVLCFAFDLLAVGDRCLMDLPLTDRKRILRELLPAPGVLRVLDHIERESAPLLAFCREHHLEGFVAKRAASPYREGPKRTDDWRKFKCDREDDFVVVGWTARAGDRKRLSALDLASLSDGDFVLRGKVGSGLDERTIDLLHELLRPLETTSAQARGRFGLLKGGRTHVKPGVVVSVRFSGWTDEGTIRHPVFRGIAKDKSTSDCTAAPPSEVLEAAPASVPVASSASPPGSTEGARARITNPKKVFWPDEGITKGDLCAYYEAVAPTLLPYLEDRPVVLVRYPDGIEGKNFFQWNAPPSMPSWMRTFTIHAEDEERTEKRIFIVNDVDGLRFVANLGCIPIHVLACRKDSLDQCDFFTIDFDLKGTKLSKAIVLAQTLRDLLHRIGLVGFPKTSGQTGLHVLVPLGPGVSFATARGLCELVARLVVAKHPDLGTLEHTVGKRGDRVYLDTGQTGPARTIVSPYSVRAIRGATVSTPLAWDEVILDLDPTRFTLATVPDRIAQRGDPMAPMWFERPSVGQAVSRLEALVREARF